MNEQKFLIGGSSFILSLALEQDELLAPIVSEMIKECPELLTASENLIEAAKGKNASSNVVKFGLDMIRVNAWIYEKKYARKMLAILLVPVGNKFEESELPGREEFMAKNATREVAQEVINFFFQRSGVFAIGTTPYSKTQEQQKKTKTR